MLHKVCLRCGRKLKTEQSQQIGFGKTCWEKYNSENKFKKLFDMEVNYAYKQQRNDTQTPGSIEQ